jgi:hypothetical protein
MAPARVASSKRASLSISQRKRVEMNENIYKLITPGEVHYFLDRNYSRQATGKGILAFFDDAKEYAGLAGLMTAGYKPEEPCVVTPLNKDDVKAALIERMETWNSLKELAAGNVDSFKVTCVVPVKGATEERETVIIGSSVLEAWEALYTEPSKAKDAIDGRRLIIPKYDGVAHFRRNATLALANAASKQVGGTVINNVPALVREFESEALRQRACISENGQKKMGARGLSPKDMLKSAWTLFQRMFTQAELGRALGFTPAQRGSTQKWYGVCAMINKYKGDGDLYQVLMDGDAANITSLSKEQCRRLAEGKDKEGNKLGYPQALAYCKNPKGQNGNDPKIMKKDGIKAIAEQAPVSLMGDVADAILNDDKSKLFKYEEAAELINTAVARIIKGTPFTFDGKAISKA